MSNVVGKDISLNLSDNVPYYPSSRQLSLPLPEAQIDLLEFLQLFGCDLQRLVGERNSGLGRVMGHSQRLLYEIEFIQLARQCLQQPNQLDGDNDLPKMLGKVVKAKVEALPNAAWNATFASKEFSTLFSVGTQALDTEIIGKSPSSLLVSLEQLQPIVGTLAQNKLINSNEVEQLLAVIGAEKYAGQLLRSMLLVENYLSGINQSMQLRLAESPLCFNHQANAQAQVWKNVFYKYYIGQVQPYLANLHQRNASLSRVIEGLLVSFTPLPEPLHRYWYESFSRENQRSVQNRFQHAVDTHTRLWQQVLSQCGMMPG